MFTSQSIVILADNMYKSLHDIVLFFLFLLQEEQGQFEVSLLIVHQMIPLYVHVQS